MAISAKEECNTEIRKKKSLNYKKIKRKILSQP